MAASREELAATKDIGPRIADSIVEYFANPLNREIIERLRAAGLQMSMPEVSDEGQTNILGGKSFVISGTFSHHSRDEYKAMIERNGGKNVGSISKKPTMCSQEKTWGLPNSKKPPPWESPSLTKPDSWPCSAKNNMP